MRCVETANQVAELLDLPIQLEWGLCEWLNSDWFPAKPKTLSIETLVKHFPRVNSSYASRVVVEYPETGREVIKRTGYTAKYLSTDFPGDLLIVGHGISVLGSTVGLLGKSPEDRGHDALLPQIPYCCLVKLVHQNPGWFIELNGDTSHLSDSEGATRFY